MPRGFFAIFRPYTDDRGRPCSLANVWEIKTIDKTPDHWHRLTEMRQDLGLLYWILIHLPAAAFVLYAGISNWIVWIAMLIVEIPVIAVLAPLVNRPLFFPLAHVFKHQAVASGACASCGYALTGLPDSPDGFLDCPECGAGWRTERLLRPEPAEGAETRRELRRHFTPDLRLNRSADTLDHRSRPAPILLFRPRRNWIGNYGELCRAAAAQIQRPAAATGLMVLCFGGAVLILTLNFVLIGARNPTPWWTYGSLVILPILIFAGFAAGRHDLFVDDDVIEEATLSRGLCPSCWELLAGLPAEADGCTICPECGAAWQLTSAASAPAPARRSRPSPAPPHSAPPTGQPNYSPGHSPGSPATKERTPRLADDLRADLHAYQASVLQGLGCDPVIINSVEDHVHALFDLSRTVSVAAAVEEVKKSSSRWLKAKRSELAGFAWQAGYGAFAVSRSKSVAPSGLPCTDPPRPTGSAKLPPRSARGYIITPLRGTNSPSPTNSPPETPAHPHQPTPAAPKGRPRCSHG